MATHDVDQKYLGRIANETLRRNPLVSKALFQILGLSVVLARRVYRARKLRKLDTSRETKSLQLYHHIIWLSREGLSILEIYVLPYTQDGQLGRECLVITAKLRASFVHIFCLFHNNPPITAVSFPAVPSSVNANPMSPYADDGPSNRRSGSITPKETTPPKRESKGKQPSLRDPIASMASDASYITNPYAGLPPGSSPPANITPQFPPGLSAVSVPQPSAFLLPSMNWVPLARTHFTAAQSSAANLLHGSHPLRLSVSIEHAAFLWDCMHDHKGARKLARLAIQQLRDREDEGLDDEGFEDAAEMVGILGSIMRRKSWESTPRAPGQVVSGDVSAEHASPADTTPEAGPSGISRRSPPRSVPAPAIANDISTSYASPRQPTRQRAYTTDHAPSSYAPSSRSARIPQSDYYPDQPTPPRRHSPKSPNPASVVGGPVGGVTPPPEPISRRTSAKSTAGSSSQQRSSHRRSASTAHASPSAASALKTPRHPSAASSRRQSHEGQIQPPLTTPPRPPPKDPGYTPGSRSSGKRPVGSSSTGTSPGRKSGGPSPRRRGSESAGPSGSGGRRVEIERNGVNGTLNGHHPQYHYQGSGERGYYVNGNGVENGTATNGADREGGR